MSEKPNGARHSDQSLLPLDQGLADLPNQQDWKIQKRVDLAIWSVLAVSCLTIFLFVLIPFYMTGGNVPSMKPGWVPTEPREYASIARYRGTIWEASSFLQDAFWHVACFGWLIWVPTILFSCKEMLLYWRFIPGSGRTIRLVILSSAILVTALWLVAVPTMSSYYDE